jgi:hypothetical protein
MRARFGEELVGPVLIRSGVPFPHASGVGLTLAPFSMENMPMNPIVHDSERWIRVDMKSLADSTPGLSYLQRPVGVASDHDSSRAALAGLRAEPPPERRQHVLGVTVAIVAGDDY